MMSPDSLGLSVTGLECDRLPLQARVYARLHSLAQSEVQGMIEELGLGDVDDVAIAYDVILGRK